MIANTEKKQMRLRRSLKTKLSGRIKPSPNQSDLEALHRSNLNMMKVEYEKEIAIAREASKAY